eukprot:94018_1
MFVMAEQKVESVVKSFQNVQFSKIQDKYDVKLEFNASLALEFMNKTNTKTYSQTFNKQNIDTITAQCKLSPENLSHVIIDQLSSIEFTKKFCRIFIFSDIKQANKKCVEFMKQDYIPEATDIIQREECTSEQREKEAKTEQRMCLLFLLHFSPSKYVKCNYCFVIEEKHLTDNDRFMIKFNELKNENEKLKNRLDKTENELTQKVNQLSQSLDQATNTINALKERVEQLDTNINNGNELKSEEIDLNLQNNWVRQSNDYAPPKAIKFGRIVYLMGSVKNGNNNNVVAILPEEWRPHKNVDFFKHTADHWTVYSNGNITRRHRYDPASLDGISFVI